MSFLWRVPKVPNGEIINALKKYASTEIIELDSRIIDAIVLELTKRPDTANLGVTIQMNRRKK